MSWTEAGRWQRRHRCAGRGGQPRRDRREPGIGAGVRAKRGARRPLQPPAIAAGLGRRSPPGPCRYPIPPQPSPVPTGPPTFLIGGEDPATVASPCHLARRWPPHPGSRSHRLQATYQGHHI